MQFGIFGDGNLNMGLSPREPKRTYRASNNGNDDEREDKHKKNNAEPPLKPHLSE